jgi:hypothetical protein
MRRIVPDLLACAIASVTLVLSLSFRSEPLRAVMVVISGSSLCCAWHVIRPHVQSRLGVVLLGVGLSTLALGCAWSGLNVMRFYLYNPAMEQVGSYFIWYEIVCTTQVVVQWCGAVVASAFVVILVISPFWIRWRRASLTGKRNLQ